MHRSVCLILLFFTIPIAALGQTAPKDCQALQGILSEVRQLRQELATSNATAMRAQIALYKLQRQDQAVAQAQQRLSDTKLRFADAESDRDKKAIEIQSARNAASHSQAPDAQTHFQEVVLPELESQLEMLQKQERNAKAEKEEAEHQLRDEKAKSHALNDLLDRYDTALAEVGRK